jgi:small-conductance mechanosensitive channel
MVRIPAASVLLAASLLLAGWFAPALAQADLVQTIVVDTSRTAPVVVDEDTLFLVEATVRGMTVEQRAGGITARIVGLAESYTIRSEDVTVDSRPDVTEIYGGDRFVMGVYDVDAQLEGVTRDSLAARYAAAIRAAVDEYRNDRSAKSLLIGAAETLLATAVFIGLLWLVSRIRGRASAWLTTRGTSVEAGATPVIRLEWIQAAALSALGLIRWALAAIFTYLYVGFVLTRFPWTRGFAVNLLNLVFEPLRVLWDGFVAYLPNLFFLIVLAIVVRYVLRALRLFFTEIGSGRIALPGFYQDWAHPTYKIVRVLVFAFAAVVAFPYIPGSTSPAFQGISIFAGILFSLGSTSAVANIVAGVILTYMRGFKVGDIVRIGDTAGRVMETTLLVTRLRTPKNVEVTIPNSAVLGTHVTNFSAQAAEGKLILPTSVTIGYDAPWRQVHAMLRQAAARTPDVLADPAPFVLQKSLDDFYVTYELNVYTKGADRMLRIYSDLHKNIQDAFNEHGVQIMSPNYEADRDAVTIVPKDRWYASPAPKPGEPGADA